MEMGFWHSDHNHYAVYPILRILCAGRRKAMEKTSIWRELLSYLKIIVIAGGLALFLNKVVVVNAQIPSESMEKTIMVGDRIFGNRLAYINQEPQRFDIVIFRLPDDESQLYIKRVIGLPGETVEVIDGQVYIDGAEEPLDDSFVPEIPYGDAGPYHVEEGCYFMMGDNRNCSEDSRFWEQPFVSRDQIEAKAGFRYYPFNKMGIVD